MRPSRMSVAWPWGGTLAWAAFWLRVGVGFPMRELCGNRGERTNFRTVPAYPVVTEYAKVKMPARLEVIGILRLRKPIQKASRFAALRTTFRSLIPMG